MINNFFVAEQIKIDPSHLNLSDGMRIVSFRIKVLDKYQQDSNYKIELNEGAGVLTSNKNGWSLQVDVNDVCGYVSTWLYKIGDLPDDEQKHFADHNIYARELSPTAYRRWVKGQP